MRSAKTLRLAAALPQQGRVIDAIGLKEDRTALGFGGDRLLDQIARNLAVELCAELIAQSFHQRTNLVDASRYLLRDQGFHSLNVGGGGEIFVENFSLVDILRDQVVPVGLAGKFKRLFAARALAFDYLNNLSFVGRTAHVFFDPRNFTDDAAQGHKPKLVARLHRGFEVVLEFLFHLVLFRWLASGVALPHSTT